MPPMRDYADAAPMARFSASYAPADARRADVKGARLRLRCRAIVAATRCCARHFCSHTLMRDTLLRAADKRRCRH